MPSVQEKIKTAKEAFQKFMETIKRLFAEQKALFERILKKVEERKIKEQKERIKDIFKSNQN
ncbi:hypothetical protein KJ636_01825 [Patescibacteria group bacterium]|nr:hypothetical protein [Patescibacteria group bacterium]MBU4480891.1 hypothetical protein [Patescibacteria group bacterium]